MTPCDEEQQMNAMTHHPIFTSMKLWALAAGCLVAFDGDLAHLEHEHDSFLPGNVARLIAESNKKNSVVDNRVFQHTHLSDEDVWVACSYIEQHRDFTAYHLLFALRYQAFDVYESIPRPIRASVICSALANLSDHTDWAGIHGNPFHNTRAVDALYETDPDCVPLLIPLLDDHRRTWQHDDPIITSWQIRRCDYAYRYLSILLGRHFVFYETPQERDREIDALKEFLKTQSQRGRARERRVERE